jgi:hypothetical protein
VIDGEAVILVSITVRRGTELHSSRQNGEWQLCAFDVLMMGGAVIRP